MKNTIFAVMLLALLPTFLCAQRDNTLFNNADRRGFFIAPIFEYSDLDDKFSTSVGGGLAFVIDDFFVGAYGLGLTTYGNIFDNGLEELNMGHGGLWLGFAFPQSEAFHLYSSVKLGGGAVDLVFNDGDLDFEDNFFIATPELGVEINVFRWFRVALTGGYRMIEGLSENSGYAEKDFEGWTAGVTLRVGGFGRNHGHRHHWHW